MNTVDIADQPAPDVRVCFVGDSFVAGVGDEPHLSWAGRVTPAPTFFGASMPNARPVCPPESHACVVLSFGVNDTKYESGQSRVAARASIAHLRAELQCRSATAG
ncbi:hypothetical protein AOC05_13470 [Arthrobacter alpinus]|uniref:SGNH hydrolase-type esterase domain-containing protein n=1 Tax=Arthrobacter alpinus TaxID=656366 RepID=A0A0M3UGP4_9MICC|nr:hypothetical protein [Arthrobacter alpinus]ALE93089.1 hypothetical protein AOC05_13470 [Arthrobacter alpinus]